MYQLSTPLSQVAGVGPQTNRLLAAQNLQTVLDLLLQLPLHYEDRSQIVTIDQLQLDQLATVKVQLTKISQFYRGGRAMTKATVSDDTGQLNCIWFNQPFLKKQLHQDQTYYLAGRLNNYHTFTQPTIEPDRAELLHTGRIVPAYTTSFGLNQGKLRRIFQEITTNLADSLATDDQLANQFQLLALKPTFRVLHFPDQEDQVIAARHRLAMEELLALIDQANQIKAHWQSLATGQPIPVTEPLIPAIPFSLTADQHQALQEIGHDLSQSQPMNRLLIGDVGTGKTMVAALAARQVLLAGHHACLIAPTQILAQQHLANWQKFFPDLPAKLMIAQPKSSTQTTKNELAAIHQPTIFIGTHRVINLLAAIQPALVIYDEQHRFGVEQRSPAGPETSWAAGQPHLLTMTATPIPRSYLLTIFTHLAASYLKTSPFGPKPIKTWLVKKTKQPAAYEWLKQQLLANPTQIGLIVCPFIEPAADPSLRDWPAAKDLFKRLMVDWANTHLKIGLLHGQMKPAQRQEVIDQLYDQKINLLVSTTIVEVGVDLPTASYLIIEGAEKFGLASLHQLRGRVGRQGQTCYCLVHPHSTQPTAESRLATFCQELDGFKLAELDLQNRGAGNLFGVEQHGLANLKFGSWQDLSTITQAQQISHQLTPALRQKLLFAAPLPTVLPAAN